MNNVNELRLESVSHTPRPSPRAPKGRWRRRWVIGLVLSLVLGLGLNPAAAMSLRSAETTKVAALGPGTVFSSIEEAAFDALRFVTLEKDQRYRGRLRAGTIFRVGEGFSYREPMHSRGTVWSSASPIVRFEYTEADVASYVVHPRSGRSSIDEANEGLRSGLEQRFEGSGGSTRLLFLLTPTHRVIRYTPGEKAEFLSGLEGRTVAALVP